MNTKFRTLLIVIATIIGLGIFGSTGIVSAQEGPNAWTENVCAGGAAIVYQSPDETGDGVTISTNTDQPDENRDGCDQSTALSWLVVEPWGNGQMNADAACLAGTWQEVGVFANRMQWLNGSAWRVERTRFESHPMVVMCSSVNNRDQLGLNPNENQISPERMDWVQNRAVQLAGGNLSSYCGSFGTEPLARLVCNDSTPAREGDGKQFAGDPEQPGLGDGAQGDGSTTTFDIMKWLANPSVIAGVTNGGLIALVLLLLFVIWWWRNRNTGHSHTATPGHNPTNTTHSHTGIVGRTRNWIGGNGHKQHSLHIKTDTLPSAEVGKAYTAKVEIEHPSGAVIYSVNNAPTGVVIDGSGTISWTNPIQGIYVMRIKVQDDDEVKEKNLTLTVNAPAVSPLTAEQIVELIRSNQPAPTPAPQIDYDQLASAIARKQGNPTSGRGQKASGQQ